MIAPARPIARVPTGTPAGIWTIDSRLSMPFSAWLSTGTPRTGKLVIDAAMLATEDEALSKRVEAWREAQSGSVAEAPE